MTDPMEAVVAATHPRIREYCRVRGETIPAFFDKLVNSIEFLDVYLQSVADDELKILFMIEPVSAKDTDDFIFKDANSRGRYAMAHGLCRKILEDRAAILKRLQNVEADTPRGY